MEECLISPKEIHVPDTITICIAGDIMMHSRQMEYDFHGYFKRIEHLFKDADITIANMEFTLAGEPYTGYPKFSAPDSYAEFIAESGIDIFLCANNHILDKGSEGAERTLEQYRKLNKTHGISFTGAAGCEKEFSSTTPLIIECRGSKIALINFTYGTNLGSTLRWPKINYQNQKEVLKTSLTKANEQADYTLVLPHWGDEYQLMHSAGQRDMAEWLIANGADIIVGAHPHVIQDMESIENIPVIYSLGNLVSNMSAPNTQLGMIMTIKLLVKLNGDLILESTHPTYVWCSRPGGADKSYTIIPVEDEIHKRSGWIGEWEYEKMTSTYERIRNIQNK